MNLMKLSVVLIFVLLSAGCRFSIKINPQGLKEFASYQIQRKLESIARDQLEEEFESDPSMRFEEYESKRRQIVGYSRSIPKNEMIIVNNFVINNRGHLKLDIKGKRNRINDTYDYKIFKTKKSPVRLRTGLNTGGSFKIGVEIEDLNIWVKSRRGEDFEFWVTWVLKF